MHELSLARSLCRQLEQALHERGLNRALRVQLSVGSLSCVDSDALQFAFAAISGQTPLEGCELSIRRIPARASCRDCGSCYPLDNWLAPCPNCGSLLRDIDGGDEVLIDEMEAR